MGRVAFRITLVTSGCCGSIGFSAGFSFSSTSEAWPLLVVDPVIISSVKSGLSASEIEESMEALIDKLSLGSKVGIGGVDGVPGAKGDGVNDFIGTGETGDRVEK